MKKNLWIKSLLMLCCGFSLHAQAQKRTFVHPGITYTQADLDRMKAMVEARQEPFYTTYLNLLDDRYSKPGNGAYEDITQIKEGRFNATIGSDGRRAHDMALLYHITGDRKYADDAVARLNRYKRLTNASSRGTAPLDNGKIYMLIEAAELLRDYEGWAEEDREAFKKMLVYPFYSTKVSAESHKSLTDDNNDVSFYWNIYNFDPGRFGNQGLFAARGLMAMGIFLDNDTIYERGYRYLTGLPARTDDLPLRMGPPIQGSLISEDEFKCDYNVSWPSTGEPYYSDEVLKYYIYRNGQCQESCRDQGHTMGGIGNYTAIAEMTWNQGDTLYSCLDNRILKGIEFNIRYNLSGIQSFDDQPEPWEPSAYTDNEDECSFENNKFYKAVSRSKRWAAKSMAYGDRGKVFGTGGWKTQALEHYRVRAGLPAEDMVWLQRAYDKMMADYGCENWGVAPNWFYEWAGWGTLTKKRTEWMAGDAGTWKDGKRMSGIPTVPCTVKAADYDYYTENGEMHTYHNVGTKSGTVYRADGTVELACEGDDVYVTAMEDGEWMSYTLIFPAPEYNTATGLEKKYNVYATYRATASGTSLFAAVDGGKKIGKKMEPTGEWTEKLLGTLTVKCGAAVLRVYVQGKSGTVELKNLRVAPLEQVEQLAVNLQERAVSVKVYDANGNDKTEEWEAAVTAASDGIKDQPISLKNQYFMVYDFGEDGIDLNKVVMYNDGAVQDTREQAKVLGSTADGPYTGSWNVGAASDFMRTNGTVYGGVSVIDDSWVTEDGSMGSYAVGPVGRYRYMAVYNWSAYCRISEVEVWSGVNMSVEKEDEEPSAEWGGQPVLSLTSPKWYAGDTELAARTVSPRFTLQNTGDADLVVTGVTSLTAPWSTSFDLQEGSVLAPGETYGFNFVFTPERIGVWEEEFAVETNAGRKAIRLVGDGIDATSVSGVTGEPRVSVTSPRGNTLSIRAAQDVAYRVSGVSGMVLNEGRVAAFRPCELRLPCGIYIVSVFTSGGMQAYKLVVGAE